MDTPSFLGKILETYFRYSKLNSYSIELKFGLVPSISIYLRLIGVSTVLDNFFSAVASP
jgi:hypothetical protein